MMAPHSRTVKCNIHKRERERDNYLTSQTSYEDLTFNHWARSGQSMRA